MDLVKEITAKSASLPPDLQHEVLDFVDFVTGKQSRVKTDGKPFKTVRGILAHDLPNLEADLAAVRAEMWHKFPSEDGK
ncbi:MAG: DUF2281 domain-containing protein [Pyrinomonadaceae bacterium]